MDRKKILLIAGIFVIIILGILLVILFFRGKSGSNNPNGNSNAPVTLEYWGLWEPEEVMAPIIKKYENDNPHVKIVYTQRTFNQYEETVFTRLEQGASSNTPVPDIIRINNTWLSRLHPYLAPLPQNVMNGSDYVESFYPTAVNDFTWSDGNIYAIPLEIDGLALYYNKEILQKAGINEPPNNWNDLRDLAIQLTERDAQGNITQAGLGIGSASNVLHSADILALLMLQNGVELTSAPYNRINLTSTGAVEAMRFYTDFLTRHKVWDDDARSDLEMFFSGKLAMMFGPSWRAFDIIESNPRVEFGIVPTPNISESSELYYSMYWGEAVSATSKSPTEAWRFIKYLSEQEQLQTFYSNSINVAGRAFGEPYSRVDMSSELFNNPYVKPFIHMAPNMEGWKMGEQSFIENELRKSIDDVAVNDADPSTALTNAQSAINQKLSSSIPTR